MKKLCAFLLSIVLVYSVAICFGDTASLAVGSIVIFGRYEQDNDPDNGPEPVEWIVLDVQEGKALLLSKYALDVMPFNTKFEDITWETSEVRDWLNSTFLNTAFDQTEQLAVLLTDVNNSDTRGYGIFENISTTGADTSDKVFLLSCHEANDLYFSDQKVRMCAPTDYAVAKGADTDWQYTVDGRNATMWWLRSLASYWQPNAARVEYDGSISVCAVDCKEFTVRPAIWVELANGAL